MLTEDDESQISDGLDQPTYDWDTVHKDPGGGPNKGRVPEIATGNFKPFLDKDGSALAAKRESNTVTFFGGRRDRRAVDLRRRASGIDGEEVETPYAPLEGGSLRPPLPKGAAVARNARREDACPGSDGWSV